jgi:hypothetical protein
MSSVLWGMMRNRKRVGVYLNGTNRVQISAADRSITGSATIPYLIADARSATKVDSSTYRASGSLGPRQVVAFDNLRWSLTNYTQIKYLLEQGKFDFLTEVNEEKNLESPTDFILYQNYPNPFGNAINTDNPLTKIRFYIPNVIFQRAQNENNVTLSLSKSDFNVSLVVYDILGKEIATLVNEYKPAGTYEIEFDASKLASGIYFYKLSVGNFTETKSMLLLK